MFGQSGTDKPAPWLVTSPPIQTSTNVAAAVASAKRRNAGLSAGMLSVSMDDSFRKVGAASIRAREPGLQP